MGASSQPNNVSNIQTLVVGHWLCAQLSHEHTVMMWKLYLLTFTFTCLLICVSCVFSPSTLAFLLGSLPWPFNLLEEEKVYSMSPSLKSYGSSPGSRSTSTPGCWNRPKVWMWSRIFSSEILNLLWVWVYSLEETKTQR